MPELCSGAHCNRCQSGEGNYLRLTVDCVDNRGKKGFIFLYADQADILVEYASAIGLIFTVSKDKQEYSPLKFEIVGHSRGGLGVIYGRGDGGESLDSLAVVEN